MKTLAMVTFVFVFVASLLLTKDVTRFMATEFGIPGLIFTLLVSWLWGMWCGIVVWKIYKIQ